MDYKKIQSAEPAGETKVELYPSSDELDFMYHAVRAQIVSASSGKSKPVTELQAQSLLCVNDDLTDGANTPTLDLQRMKVLSGAVSAYESSVHPSDRDMYAAMKGVIERAIRHTWEQPLRVVSGDERASVQSALGSIDGTIGGRVTPFNRGT